MTKTIAMKNYLFILFIISIYSCNAQNGTEFEYDNFENQFLNYKPKQNSQISKKDFDYANMIIKETKSATNNNSKNFNLADYFNVLSAFLTLKESRENIKIVFEKFKNAEGSCEYIISFEKSVEKNPKYDIIREDYNKELDKCKAKPVQDKTFNISEYSKTNNLDLALIEKINNIMLNDQVYRKKTADENKAKQRKLDIQNQKAIDSLFNVYKTYIGRTLVGEKFESTMWLVIQHSNLEMMEKYLPIIQVAFENKEIDIVPFKMLIDRIYTQKENYQIFGSQVGVEQANEKIRQEVIKKYKLK